MFRRSRGAAWLEGCSCDTCIQPIPHARTHTVILAHRTPMCSKTFSNLFYYNILYEAFAFLFSEKLWVQKETAPHKKYSWRSIHVLLLWRMFEKPPIKKWVMISSGVRWCLVRLVRASAVAYNYTWVSQCILFPVEQCDFAGFDSKLVFGKLCVIYVQNTASGLLYKIGCHAVTGL